MRPWELKCDPYTQTGNMSSLFLSSPTYSIRHPQSGILVLEAPPDYLSTMSRCPGALTGGNWQTRAPLSRRYTMVPFCGSLLGSLWRKNSDTGSGGYGNVVREIITEALRPWPKKFSLQLLLGGELQTLNGTLNMEQKLGRRTPSSCRTRLADSRTLGKLGGVSMS